MNAEVPMTVAFARGVAADEEAPALTLDFDTWTRTALWQRIGSFAAALRDRGVGEGDTVAVVLPNSHDLIAASFAALDLGATPAPLSIRMPPPEMSALIALAAPRAVVTSAAIGLDGALVVEDLETLDQVSDPATHTAPVAPSWKASGSGGSTGMPKIIRSAVSSLIDPDAPRIDRQPTDAAIVDPGPMHHTGPFVAAMTAVSRRSHAVISSRFDPERVLQQIDRYRPEFIWLVPTMMARILALPEEVRRRYDLSSLRTLMHMAAPCAPSLKEAWMDWVGDEVLLELYGSTEAAAMTTITGPESRLHPGSVGRVKVGEMKIVLPSGEDAPTGEVGDVYHRRSPDAAATYQYMGAESKPIEGGWETFGDVGYFDQNGYLYLVDRRADLIVRGGSNIYPAEVEVALQEHPAVREAVVVGVPDPDLGERVHAFLNVEGAVADEELDSFMRERVSSYKVPSTYEFVDGYLRDDGGKVRRSALRAKVEGPAGASA
jgi:bile acid-coenzyme A ligase